MKYLILITTQLFFLSYSTFVYSQNSSSFKVFLIGDAGEKEIMGATMRDLKIKLQENPNSAVIFLGDNCYKKTMYGLINIEIKGFDGSKITQKRLMSQLNTLKNYEGSAFFVPGNHDWWNTLSIEKGKKNLLLEQLFIEDSLQKFTSLKNDSNSVFLPRNGETGPISKEVNDGKIRIIFIDTYRMILEESKVKHKKVELIKQFYIDLQTQIALGVSKNQKIIIVAHHPIFAKGKHSQLMPLWQEKKERFANSNLNFLPYKKMALHIDSIIKAANQSGIYYVAGHEHSLEYFFKNNLHYIISGSGSKTDKVKFESTQSKNECVRWNEEGFFEIDFGSVSEKIIMYHRENETAELQANCVGGCEN